MKSNLAFIITFVWAASASAITIETVPVGDSGNPATSGGRGGVSYPYYIGKYEVTVGEYTEFLNAVAATDSYGLYSPAMATDLYIAGIAQNGSSPNYTYSVIGSPNHPVTYVGWGDAARFVNWLSHGQPTGPQDNTTTEDGAYTLNGAITDAVLYYVLRNKNAKWFIPTADEWYKAAYYQPAAAGGDSDGYWAYPMKTNSVPYSDQPPGATPDNSRVGNFYQDIIFTDGYDDGFAVTGSPLFSPGQNYLTDVGAYTSSSSYYGTFDQGGNVWEWTERRQGGFGGFDRYVRGGSWLLNAARSADELIVGTLSTPERGVGFRVATIVPEPSALLLTITTFAALLTRRGKSVPHTRV